MFISKSVMTRHFESNVVDWGKGLKQFLVLFFPVNTGVLS